MIYPAADHDRLRLYCVEHGHAWTFSGYCAVCGEVMRTAKDEGGGRPA